MREQHRTGPTNTTAAAVLFDTARMLRTQLNAQRKYVCGNLNELAGKRRGKTAARQLQLLADTMVDAFGSARAKAQFAEMGARIIDARRVG